jgi:predicted TIM-barrel fold metal-dependent hydrolase
METSRHSWHRLVHEVPIDARRPIVDAHHHLWREGEGPHAGPVYLHDQLLSDIAAHNVVGTIYVESGADMRSDRPDEVYGVEETRFAARIAARSTATSAPILGIVAAADLRLGERLGDVLDAHKMAGEGLFRGIRHRHDKSGAGATYNPLTDTSVLPALKLLGKRNYSFDAFALFSQLGNLTRLVRSVPDTRFILLHIGLPLTNGAFGAREDVLLAWRQGMIEAARCPNLALKLGGIGMDSLYGMGWSTRDLPPTSDEVAAWWSDDIRFCIDTFGPARCMFESNFPVDGEGVGYTVLWNAFQKIAAPYSESEQDALFAGTAIQYYKLSGLRT